MTGILDVVTSIVVIAAASAASTDGRQTIISIVAGIEINNPQFAPYETPTTFIPQLVTVDAAACSGVPPKHFIRHSASCSHYIHCTSTPRISVSVCPAAYRFDARTQTCTAAAHVDCSVCSAYGVQNMQLAATSFSLSASPTATYVRCENGRRSLRQCADGGMFDATLGVCSRALNATATAVQSNELPCMPPHDDYRTPSSVCGQFDATTYTTVGDPSDCTMQVFK